MVSIVKIDSLNKEIDSIINGIKNWLDPGPSQGLIGVPNMERSEPINMTALQNAIKPEKS
jgi:hypothetical protein